MLCHRCGHQNPAGSRYCTECGFGSSSSKTEIHTSLEVGGPTNSSIKESTGAIEPGSAMLVIQQGWTTGTQFELENQVTKCGRDAGSDVFLDDVTVSRKHAEIVRDGSTLWLVDSGSVNGTYLNGQRISRSRLKSGDKVQIGKFRLVVLVGPKLKS